MKSLFTPLKNNHLTTLKINYNYKTDHVRFFAAKEWEPDQDFSQYNKKFYAESILTDKAVYLNTEEVRELFKKEGLLDYLNQVVELLREGRHVGIVCFYNERYDLHFMLNKHSYTKGLNNKYHAAMCGGCRLHPADDDELEVIIDGLNLSRGMSFKNIAADIPFGGSKTVLHGPKPDLNNMDTMGFIGYCVDRCHILTGPDMNYPNIISDIENDNFSMQFNGGPKSPLGNTGKPTALGVYLTLKEALKSLGEDGSLKGKSAAIQGLGSVGANLAERLLEEGANLVVADIDQARVDKFLKDHPGKPIKAVKLADILTQKVDIVCPCAIGGVITEENIPQLQCKVIWGPANNQIKAHSQEEEIRLAKKLADRGILFQTEWWHNAAGVFCAAEEYMMGRKATVPEAERKIAELLPRTTRENLAKAKKLGITPTECLYKTCQDIIYA